MLVGLDLSAAFDTIEHRYLAGSIEDGIRGLGGGAGMDRNIPAREETIRGGWRGTFHAFGLRLRRSAGFRSWPFLFSIYVSPIVDIITAHGVQFHQNADDTQLYIAINSDDDLARL